MQNKNPNGPYPGRQIFVGTTKENKPCFAYLVTGRNQESRERKAKKFGNLIRIMPSKAGVLFDPLRHYIAIKYDDLTGMAVITNGIQTEAIFEAYRLCCYLRRNIYIFPELLRDILQFAGAEPDNYHTPRIAAVITPRNIALPQAVIGTIGENYGSAYEIILEPENDGQLSVVSTYYGDMDNPEANKRTPNIFHYTCLAVTPAKLAKHIFDISAAEYKGNDIRVCSIGGVFIDGEWRISIIS